MGLKRVLVIDAHVDDAVCGCAGTVLKHLECGDTVEWHTFIGKGYRVPKTWPEYSLVLEHRSAMKVLGVETYYCYPYRVDMADVITQVRSHLFRIWHDFKPDVAYVPWAGSRHQDHRAIGDFARQVSWRSDADVFAYPVTNDFSGFAPTVFSVISEDRCLLKLQAVEQFASQFVLRPWFTLDLIESFMRTYAQFAGDGVRFVEPFEQVRRTLL